MHSFLAIFKKHNKGLGEGRDWVFYSLCHQWLKTPEPSEDWGRTAGCDPGLMLIQGPQTANGFSHSLGNEKVLEVDNGDDCTTL